MKKLLNILLIAPIILGYSAHSNAMFARALAFITRYSSKMTPRTIITPRTGIISKITPKPLQNQVHTTGLPRITTPQPINRNSNLLLTRVTDGSRDEQFYNQRNVNFYQAKSSYLKQTQSRCYLMGLLGVIAASSDDDKKDPEQKPVLDPVILQAEELALEIFNEIAVTCPDPDTTLRTTLKNLPYKKQDQFLAAMLQRLLDENDKRNFKPIALLALPLKKIKKRHPELYQLIKAHAEKPNPSEFMTAFKQLTNLPPTFDQAYQRHKARIGRMRNLSYSTYLFWIYCKF